MADSSIEIVHDEFTPLIQRLIEFGFRPAPFMDLIGSRLTNKVRQQFRTSSDPYGKAWKPISNRSGQPLRDTGRLRSSMTYAVDSDGSAVEIGTNTVYARMQSLGYTGSVNVSAHDRLIKSVFGRTLPSAIRVRVSAHTRKMNVPGRAILPDQRGMPTKWQEGIRASIMAYLTRIERGNV